MRYKLALLVLFLSIYMISIVSAEILLNQPNAIYNYGDKLDIKATLKSSQDIDSFFILDLNCENNSYNFYKIPLSMKNGEQKTIETSLFLEKAFSSPGLCEISASYNGENKESQGFKLSQTISVTLNIYDLDIEAGKIMNIKGNAINEDGKKTNGFVEAQIENTDIKSSGIVNGNFSIEFLIPENQKSGTYNINIRVYEKYKDSETNHGETVSSVNIKQTPKKIQISIPNMTINPPSKLTILPIILDQAGDIIAGELKLKIISPENKIFMEEIVSSNSDIPFVINSNSSPGYWTIESSYLNLSENKQFLVAEYEKADFTLENNTLIITNIGNVIYRKNVEIELNDFKDLKNIELGVGESMKLLLKGDGDYNLRVYDGKDEIKLQGISLTGGVVGIEEIRQRTSLFLRYPLVLIFLILVAGLFVYTLFRKTWNRTSYSYPSSSSLVRSKISNNIDNSGIIRINSSGKFSGDLSEAEHMEVIDGRKENSTVIALKIRNMDSVRKSDQIKFAENTIKNNKGAVYKNQDFIIGIFASPTTKTFLNELIAIKAAKNIDEILKGYNKIAKTKIDYGIGVHNGELALKKENNLKFTSVGNTLSLAKRISEIAKEELLISPSVNTKLMSEIKSEKINSPGVDAYRIKSISQRENNEKFIQGFLSRQRK